ncbi:hypothetical protein CVS40_5370 [Lucilia cuprina]|nr:hypothetical protein CVS40_5370 [Lucilia cuprina]
MQSLPHVADDDDEYIHLYTTVGGKYLLDFLYFQTFLIRNKGSLKTVIHGQILQRCQLYLIKNKFINNNI